MLAEFPPPPCGMGNDCAIELEVMVDLAVHEVAEPVKLYDASAPGRRKIPKQGSRALRLQRSVFRFILFQFYIVSL